MKRIETSKLYTALMIFCFLFGGFNLITSFMTFGISISTESNMNSTRAFDNNIEFNMSAPSNFPRQNDLFKTVGINLILSNSIITFFNGIIFILAGISIFYLSKKREDKKLRENIMYSMLTIDELEVVKYLEKHEAEATQKELVVELNISKVKISRILKSLENKKIITKSNYGMTNKIMLK